MNIPFIDLQRAYAANEQEFDARILKVARSGAYVLGRNVAALEQDVAAYLGVEHCVAVGSGTDALHLGIAALGIGPGDEVITTPFTFAATIEAIEYVGATAVLVDIDAATCNIDASRIEAAITSNTKCIAPVHMFGLPADMPRIMELADQYGLSVIEDCAQSFGARCDGRQTGSFGHAGAFSFYPTKTLACLGDGGMVSAKDAAVAQRLRELRNHGIGDRGEHVRLGFNSRLDEVQAAILRIRLKSIDAMVERRRHIARRYSQSLAATGAQTPPDADGHGYNYYTILVDDRDALRKRLTEAQIATALYYPKALHQHTYYAKSCRFDALDVADDVARRCVSLPVFPELTDAEVDYVASVTAASLS
jgi:dTDP-4-amino-4,6-dideoxygalactose transaminase